MTALAVATPITRMEGKHASWPVYQATKILQGAMIGITTGGYARAFVLGDIFAGHALDTADNTNGASGAINVKATRGRYILRVTLSGVAITDPWRQAPVFALDSGTLSIRIGQQVGRVIRYVSSGVAMVEFDTAMQITCLAETMLFGGFTDGGSTSGYKDFATALPVGALVLGWEADVKTGFTGDTTATLAVGVSGATSKFSVVTTTSVVAAAVKKCSVLGTTATVFLDAAATIRATITGTADFTSIAAGEMDLKIFYGQFAR